MVHSVLKIYIRTNHSHAPDSNTDDSQPEDSLWLRQRLIL